MERNNLYLRKYILYGVALLLIIIDIPISAIPYPVYVPFHTEAPETVSLVIEHVVSDSMRIDLLSDLVGLVLLAVLSFRLVPKGKRFGKTFVWALSTFCFRVFYMIAPFMQNGDMRFRFAYVLYFVCAVLEVITLFMACCSICSLLESRANHSYNNVTLIMAMLSVGCGFVHLAMWFFDILVISYIYLAAQLIFFGVFAYRAYRDRDMLEALENDANVAEE